MVLCPIPLNHNGVCGRWCFSCVDNTSLGILLIGQSLALGQCKGKRNFWHWSNKHFIKGICWNKKAALRKTTFRSSCRGRNSCCEHTPWGFGVSQASLVKQLLDLFFFSCFWRVLMNFFFPYLSSTYGGHVGGNIFFLKKCPQFSLSVDEFMEGNSHADVFYRFLWASNYTSLLCPTAALRCCWGSVMGLAQIRFLVVIKQICIQTL